MNLNNLCSALGPARVFFRIVENGFEKIPFTHERTNVIDGITNQSLLNSFYWLLRRNNEFVGC